MGLGKSAVQNSTAPEPVSMSREEKMEKEEKHRKILAYIKEQSKQLPAVCEMIENGYLSAKQYFKGQMLIPGEYIFLQTQVVNATSQQSSA